MAEATARGHRSDMASKRAKAASIRVAHAGSISAANPSELPSGLTVLVELVRPANRSTLLPAITCLCNKKFSSMFDLSKCYFHFAEESNTNYFTLAKVGSNGLNFL
jgi:hypothetical protein